MSYRNVSPAKMFAQWALEHQPRYRFSSQPGQDFASWKAEALPQVLATLGDWPTSVPPNPEMVAEWEHDGIIKQRWLIDIGRHLSTSFLVNRPKDLKPGEKRPTLFCWHGHGSYGKESVMGNDSTPARKADIAQNNYNYGHQMAQQGFVTYAIDWMGIGEMNDQGKPSHVSAGHDKEPCDTYYLHATMLGMTPLSINLTHGKAATDFACGLPFVDPNRLGVMGLSGGGTMTLWTALTDQRFRAAEIMCYSDIWEAFAFRDVYYCGMQIAPGLYKLVDLPDLQGLIAPKPLLVDIGIYDSCFLLETAMQCYKQVEAIYKAAGASNSLELDCFPGEHAWGGNKSVEFFRKHLSA